MIPTLADLAVRRQPRMNLNNRVQNTRNCCAGKLARLGVFNSANAVGWRCRRCLGIYPIHFLFVQFDISVREEGDARGWIRGGQSRSF